MAYRVDLTNRAIRDLQKLYVSVNAEHSDTARDWFDGLEKAILTLDTSPNRHPVAPEAPSLRHLLFSSRSYVYRAIFRVDEERQVVTVLHIRHGSRRSP